MKQIEAKVIADSKNTFGDRITTFVVTFPRIILAELNTHRVFSRNSASSRAIPFEKMLKMVKDDPFVPIAWQKDHKGMQGTEYLSTTYKQGINKNYDTITTGNQIDIWLEARKLAIDQAKELSRLEVTKQVCNRLLEPFMWHTAIITTTELENFFDLRCPKYRIQCMGGEVRVYRSKKDALKGSYEDIDFDTNNIVNWLEVNQGQAEIHMMALAEAIWDAYNESTPKQLKEGEWHIPFGDNISYDKIEELAIKLDLQRADTDYGKYLTELFIKVAVARCARVSYLNFEGKDDYEADIKLYNSLLKSKHASPFEHCASAMSKLERYQWRNGFLDNSSNEVIESSAGWCRNFRGFIQQRALINL